MKTSAPSSSVSRAQVNCEWTAPAPGVRPGAALNDYLLKSTEWAQRVAVFVNGSGRQPSARETKRLQTRERLMGAADCRVQAIRPRRGRRRRDRDCRRGRTRHVLLPFPHQGTRAAGTGAARRGAHRQTARPLRGSNDDLASMLEEAVRLVMGLERRLGAALFKDFLALHFSQTRPADESRGTPSHRDGGAGDRACASRVVRWISMSTR